MSADFWAGYLSGAAGIVIGNPLDLIKVRLQATPQSSITTAAASSPSPSTSPTLTTRPPLSTRALLKGLPAPILTYGALNALLFTTYNRSLLLLSPPSPASPTPTPHHPYLTHFAAGCLAGLATFLISTPTELIKCRAQLTPDTSPASARTPGSSSSSSSWKIARATWQHHGLRGLYRGGAITSVRDAVGYGFYFLTYEASKDVWDLFLAGPPSPDIPTNTVGANEAAKVLLCGGLAGVATWASIFPLDVIKTRVQTQSSLPSSLYIPSLPPTSSNALTPLVINPSTSTPNNSPPGAWAMAQHAYRTEGIHVFFRGLTVCCVRAFVVNAVQWAVYEWMMRYLLH